MTFAERVRHVRARRRELRRLLEGGRAFAAWEETCVPSYCHPNQLAALVSWWRLFAAADLGARLSRGGPVLDFGAGTGELADLLPPAWDYHFVEQRDAAAASLRGRRPGARRRTLTDLGAGYRAIFALDSLEHNRDHAQLLARLAEALAPDGVLILSGPTESRAYRLGRRIAGFDAHYHQTDVFELERVAAALLSRCALVAVPPLLPLFRLTAWAAGTGAARGERRARRAPRG